MAKDYPDWNFPNYLVDQSTELYLADVLTKLLENYEVIEKQLLKEGGILYCLGSVIVRDNGALYNAGTLQVIED
ncbi:MAG: hypothetical protein DRP29_01965 [Thermodesulfobacteriota bacterium]|nr:MAG: hypothetical protein DRP29_01965 [Thermodesulfobacteriota bacterium]